MLRALETILKDDVQEVFDRFCACFNIRILFYSPAGEELKVGLNHPDSSYCQLVQGHLFGLKTCLNLDAQKRREALAAGKMVCYRCHAGLVEAIKPVFYENRLLGYVAIGQFRCERALPKGVAALWRQRREMTALDRAYRGLPCVPQTKIDDILGLFSILVDYIVLRKMVILKGRSVLEEVRSFVFSHPAEDIRLAEAAAHVRRSPSTISHLFRAKTGRSFKHFVIETKLAQAEEHMTNEPSATVAEAAARVGYLDALYFSRLYKRYRGYAPSQYRIKPRPDAPLPSR
jgi:AraC-like DNA-binding protein/ligand-binding sensor protein